MKRRILSCLFAILVGMTCAFPAFAEEMQSTMDFQQAEREKPLVVNEAGVLSGTEEAELNALAEEISEQYQCETAVVYVNTLDGMSAMEYADDYYDYNGYGYGADDDGILLLVAVESRDYWVTTHGTAIRIFTDSRLDSMAERYVPYLRDEDWVRAAEVFLQQAERYLQSGPYEEEDVRPLPFGTLVIFIPLGILLAGIPMRRLKRQLVSVEHGSRAADYLVKGGIQFTRKRDIFLRKHITRERIETESSGRSSAHQSSSGRTHGGSGGKF